MRRSSGMGGGSMLRAVGRAVGAGVGGAKEAIAAGGVGRSGKPARLVRVASSGPSSPTSATASGPLAGWSSCSHFGDGEEWEAVGEEEVEVEEEGWLSEPFVFGRAPSKEEVEEAVSTLQQIYMPVTFSRTTEDGHPFYLDQVADDKAIISATPQKTSSIESSTDSESDWIEPAWHLYSSEAFQSKEHEKVLDAFRLLQINPSIQRMVASLSSDKTVWDAVMKNEVVQELKKSFHEVGNYETQSSDEQPDVPTGILRWMLESTKSKLMEFIDKITKLVSDLFHSQEKDENSNLFNDVVRSSFMLSVVVFIIVVVTRIQKA